VRKLDLLDLQCNALTNAGVERIEALGYFASAEVQAVDWDGFPHWTDETGG
jgi:hypothetical protein